MLLCGGLGPTKDDLTKEVTAKVFGRKLYEDSQDVYKRQLVGYAGIDPAEEADLFRDDGTYAGKACVYGLSEMAGFPFKNL